MLPESITILVKEDICEDFFFNNLSPYQLHVKYDICIEDIYIILKNNNLIKVIGE